MTTPYEHRDANEPKALPSTADRLAAWLAILGFSHTEPWLWIGTAEPIAPHTTTVPIYIAVQAPEPNPNLRQRTITAFNAPLPLTGDYFHKWAGYAFEMIGQGVHPTPSPVPFPHITLALPNGHPLHLELWWQRIAYGPHREPWAELHWHPGLDAPREHFGGLTRRGRQGGDQMDVALHGVDLLYHLPEWSRRGKQAGDGARFASEAEFLALLDDAVRAVQRATGRRLPDTDAVIRKLPIEKSAFYTWVKRATGQRWHDVARNYAEFNGIARPDTAS